MLVTGIQPDQVLGLNELFPRRRRGAALISVTSTEMRKGEISVLRYGRGFPPASRTNLLESITFMV
ncbi:hypothetical protein EBB04_06610 [Sinorhizobium meliloti]|nr:hypothetical protein EBB04_06610 [Sinorhizobium meliloti]